MSPRLPVPPLSVERHLAEPILLHRRHRAAGADAGRQPEAGSRTARRGRALAASCCCSGSTARSAASPSARRGRCASRAYPASSSMRGLPRSKATSMPAMVSISCGCRCLPPRRSKCEQADLAGETSDDERRYRAVCRPRPRPARRAGCAETGRWSRATFPSGPCHVVPFAEAPHGQAPERRRSACRGLLPGRSGRSGCFAIPSRSRWRPPRCRKAAAQFPLAARPLSGRARGRARAHRAGMVARARPAADPRLFPRRGRGGPPLLALPAGPLRRCRSRAALVHAWAFRMNARRPPMPNSPSSRISPSCAAPRSRRSWWSPPSCWAFRRSALPTATRWPGVVRAWQQAKVGKIAYHPGCRLVFSDGTPDMLAYPQDRKGWGHLCRMLTQANMRDESEKGAPDALSRRSSRMGRPHVAGRPAGSRRPSAEDDARASAAAEGPLRQDAPARRGAAL